MPAVSTISHRHLFIAGTGRAGTTFLVRYLNELGLDTHLSHDKNAALDKNAHAGLEDMPFVTPPEKLPYVVKCPWLCEFVDQVLASRDFQIDAVIIPVRSLVEAAASRVVLERRAMHETAPWLAELEQPWQTWARNPGGVVYSLNCADQARLLATGFYQLVERLVRADIPMVFLDFPRMAEDAEYLFKKMRPYLPAETTLAQAQSAQARVADGDKIRIDAELEAAARASGHRPISSKTDFPGDEQLDLIAMHRELSRLRDAHKQADIVLGHSIKKYNRAQKQLNRFPTCLVAYPLHLLDEAWAWLAGSSRK